MKTTVMTIARWIIASGVLISSLAGASTIEGIAPDFTLKSKSGENLKLSEFRGEVVMINFWASWCGPCRQEMPILEAMYDRYKELGFTILGVNVEKNSKNADKLLKSIPVSFPILYDNKNQVSELYDVIAMPSTILVDRDGNMRYLHRGYEKGYEIEYEEQVRGLLRE